MSGTLKIRSLFRSLTQYWPAAVFKWLSVTLILLYMHSYTCSQYLRQTCKHSWFVPRFPNSAYCNRIEPFFFSAYLMCVCDIDVVQILQRCMTLHFSITDPYTGPHSSWQCVFVCVWSGCTMWPIQCCKRGCDLWCFKLWLPT